MALAVTIRQSCVMARAHRVESHARAICSPASSHSHAAPPQQASPALCVLLELDREKQSVKSRNLGQQAQVERESSLCSQDRMFAFIKREDNARSFKKLVVLGEKLLISRELRRERKGD
eukprot:2973749-Pleurochrysis_carterae.AAC.2